MKIDQRNTKIKKRANKWAKREREKVQSSIEQTEWKKAMNALEREAMYLVEFEGLHRRKAALVVNGEQLQVQRVDLIDRRRRLRPALGLGQLGNLSGADLPITWRLGNTEIVRRSAKQIHAV